MSYSMHRKLNAYFFGGVLARSICTLCAFCTPLDGINEDALGTLPPRRCVAVRATGQCRWGKIIAAPWGASTALVL